jgi:transposase
VEEAAVGQRGAAFDSRVGVDAEAASAREIEKLHAKIGQLKIENDFFAKRFGK